MIRSLEETRAEGLFVMCSHHQGQKVCFYCLEDDELLCTKCAVLTHKKKELVDAGAFKLEEKVNTMLELNEQVSKYFGD